MTNTLPSFQKLNRINKIIDSFQSDSIQYLSKSNKLHPSLVSSFILTDNQNNDIGFINLFRLKVNRFYSNKICYLSYGIIPEFQNKGYSKILLNKVIEMARENNFKEIHYHVDRTNIKSIRAISSFDLFQLKKEFKSKLVYFTYIS